MSQINSNIKDDFQVVLLLPCFVGRPVRLNEFLNFQKENTIKEDDFESFRIFFDKRQTIKM